MADPAPPSVGIGLLGLGVVGAGVYAAIAERGEAYAQRVGRAMTVRAVAVRDSTRPRTIHVPADQLTVDPMTVATHPDVDIVVEVMGGVTPAAECIRAALEAGKHVVTANKEVMAKHGPELLAIAAKQGVELRYEASVGGGIPIIAALTRDLRANEVQSIHAVINGTTNFMLTAMAQDGASYDAALAEAQRRGYAEADPSADVDGIDARYKIAILASLAFRTTVHPADVYCEGITALQARDFRYAEQLGYRIRLLAVARRLHGGLDVRVHPVLLPENEPLAKVEGVLNAVAVEGDLVGRAVFEGEGAGSGPTTSAVLADLLEVISDIEAGMLLGSRGPVGDAPEIVPVADLTMRYYLRILVRDQPGVLAAIGSRFADDDISIASLLQMEEDAVAGTAEIIITTHLVREADLDICLADLADVEDVREIGIRIRMESSDE